MGTHVMDQCRTHCRARRSPRRRSVVARITALALALGAFVLVFSGEHWMLAEAPRTPDELTLAVCALDDVYGVRPAAVCINPNVQQHQGHTL
jgi:hypothetical protein